MDVGNSTTVSVPNLTAGTNYFFVVGAYSSGGLESTYSNQISYLADSSVPPVVTGNATNLWPGTAIPKAADGGADTSVELGVKFKSDVAGSITGIRFYKSSANTGTHVGNLWSSGATRLATATFSNETSSGWQQVNFAAPVSIMANTVYVASYHVAAGHYGADSQYFSAAGLDNPPLHALANGVSGGNGVYAYGTGSIFPGQTWNAANYWVDVVFQSNSLPLQISSGALANATLNAAYSAALTGNGGTAPYTWAIASGTLPAGLMLNATNGAITGIPTVAGTFSFTVRLTDKSNPIQTVTKALGITVGAASATKASIWPGTTMPKRVDGGVDNPVELGLKFKSDVAGTITGIRFYKASTNTGAHIGNLWSNSGTRLATATFAGETASGWQQVNLTTPVSIAAGTTYVVSYHVNAGHYSADANFFSTAGVDNLPLHALSNSVAGGNGVYAYGTSSVFPALVYGACNYWVDVVFQAAP